MFICEGCGYYATGGDAHFCDNSCRFCSGVIATQYAVWGCINLHLVEGPICARDHSPLQFRCRCGELFTECATCPIELAVNKEKIDYGTVGTSLHDNPGGSPPASPGGPVTPRSGGVHPVVPSTVSEMARYLADGRASHLPR